MTLNDQLARAALYARGAYDRQTRGDFGPDDVRYALVKARECIDQALAEIEQPQTAATPAGA